MRKEVEEFAKAMEEKLKKNDWKGGWTECSDLYLLDKISEKLDTIVADLTTDTPTEEVCVDLANYVMMLYDNIVVRRQLNAENRKV